jgi:hypothetical protein
MFGSAPADECAEFSDIVLIGFCRKEKPCVMTDDADYDIRRPKLALRFLFLKCSTFIITSH